jgi:hypothetical protein
VVLAHPVVTEGVHYAVVLHRHRAKVLIAGQWKDVKTAPDQPGTAGAGLIPLQRRRTGPIDVTSEAITVPIARPAPALDQEVGTKKCI